MSARRPRVLYVLEIYAQLSETYVQTEIRTLAPDHELGIVCLNPPSVPDPEAHPYTVLPSFEAILEHARAFRPDVLHSHWLFNVERLDRLARALGVPYTVRAHSFDAMVPRLLGLRSRLRGRYRGTLRTPRHLLRAATPVNAEHCLGVLTFPFTRPLLERVGMRPDKLIDCWPVIDYERFHDRSPNGDGVMNVGAIGLKKKMSEFVDVAAGVPGTAFDLFPVSVAFPQAEAALRERNRRHGHPVKVHAPVPHAQMPAVYKQHRWLVYTASRRFNTVGWPLSVAEAQASGTGVLMPALRPDLEDYLGGAGYSYRSPAEARDRISRPFPEDLRQRGFEHARRSDIARHKHLLTDLWAKFGPSPPVAPG